MHKVTRECDEMACSCGLRWDIEEDDPHVDDVDPFNPNHHAELELKDDEEVASKKYIDAMREGQVVMATGSVNPLNLESCERRFMVETTHGLQYSKGLKFKGATDCTPSAEPTAITYDDLVRIHKELVEQGAHVTDDMHQLTKILGIDLAHPDGDRTIINGHELYKDSDFTDKELARGNKLGEMVVEGGLNVCRKCGEYESGLDEWCKK